jgi:hypothetical protein
MADLLTTVRSAEGVLQDVESLLAKYGAKIHHGSEGLELEFSGVVFYIEGSMGESCRELPRISMSEKLIYHQESK